MQAIPVFSKVFSFSFSPLRWINQSTADNYRDLKIPQFNYVG